MDQIEKLIQSMSTKFKEQRILATFGYIRRCADELSLYIPVDIIQIIVTLYWCMIMPQKAENYMRCTGSTEKEVAHNCIQRLKKLKTLYDDELITEEDYETRKSQIVDELTGTSSINTHKKDAVCVYCRRRPVSNSLNRNKRKKNLKVVKHEAPDWSLIQPEKAEKYIYDYDNSKWFKQNCKIKIDAVPFDKGSLRYVFHLQDLTTPETKYVAKMSQDQRDTNIKKKRYFNAVRMQTIARHFCHGTEGYNSYWPPKYVDFLEAYVLHLKERERVHVCFVERYIEGSYKKYNHNWVSEHERNTQHTFTHFTYEASKRKLIVYDIQGQGVCDIYTDPQVYYVDDGGGVGRRCFENFLRTHRCNPICQYLKLKNINELDIRRMPSGNSGLAFPLLCEKGFPTILENEENMKENNGNNDGENTSCWSQCVCL